MRASTEMKKRFLEDLFSEDSKYNSALLTKRKYDSIIEDVKRIKFCKKKESSRDYRLIQRYDVLTVQGREKLIQPLTEDARHKARTYYVHADELFDILHSTHLSINHGGRDRMMKELNKLYKNITQAQVRMFLNVCKTCLGKRMNKEAYVKPVGLLHFNSRFHLDFIDYQFQPDDMPYKCSVKNCRGNYDNGEKVSVFKFPNDDGLRKLWIHRLKGQAFKLPTSNTRVCELHFRKEEILREAAFVDPRTGKVLRAPLQYPRLKTGAVPSIILGISSNLQPCSSGTQSRESPDSKRAKLEAKNLEEAITANQISKLAMANATSESQAVRNGPSSSSPYSQEVDVIEHPLVKQEILSDEESPSVDATHHSNVALLSLKSLIAKLRSNDPQQPSTSIKVEPDISEQLPDPTPFSPVITDVRPMKPDPDDPNANQFPSAHSSHKSIDTNQELYSFVASSLVDCQLGDGSSSVAAVNSSFLGSSSVAAVNSSSLGSSLVAAAVNSSSLGSSSVAAAVNSSFLRADAPSSFSGGSPSVAAALYNSSLRTDAPSSSAGSSSVAAAVNSSSLRADASSAGAGSPSVAAVNNSSLRANASSSSSSGSSSVAAAMYNSSLRADAPSSAACSSSFATAVNSSFLHADAPSSFLAGSSSVAAAVYNSSLHADAPSSSAGLSSVAAAVNSSFLRADASSSSAGDGPSSVAAAVKSSSLRADAPSSSSAGSSSVAAKNSSSLRDAAQSSSSSSAGDELELCDHCGSYVRKVKGVTVHPKKNVHQSNPYNMRKRKAGSVFCCDSSMCSMGDNRVTEEEIPVDSRLAKFQAYGQVLAQRLRRLPPRTSSLVQSVIEELLFNAEDGQYDGYLSTKGVLKKRAPVRSLKQIGGFNGYED